MAQKKETFIIKTLNGNVHISRTETQATITEERTCFGFKEKSVIHITKLNDDCLHYVFGSVENITETLKNN